LPIETLLHVVPPPARPFDAFTWPWHVIESELGTRLPQDYKDFCRLYGAGYFMQFLGVHVPNTQNPNTRFDYQVGLVVKGFAYLEEAHYPFWPEPGGLIPFGATDNGDYLFWLPRGETPDDWPVVVWDRGGGDEPESFEVFDRDLTDFLAGLATGTINPRAFPKDLLPCELLFQPDGEFQAGAASTGVAPMKAGTRMRFEWRPFRWGA